MTTPYPVLRTAEPPALDGRADLPGLRSATYVDGALNDASVVSRGWTAEIRFPWAGMRAWAGDRALPSRGGDEWRIFFGRFQKLSLGGHVHGAAWSWDVIGSTDNNRPERFTRVRFSTDLG